MGRSGRTSLIISAAIFILLEIAAVSMLSRSSVLQNIWLNRLSHRVMAATWGGSEKVRNYFSLEKSNEILAQQNFELAQKVRRYENILTERDRTAKIDSLGVRDEFVFTMARIVQMTTNTQHNYFVIDKGYDDGVAVNSGVITDNGVVGIIEAVDKHFAYGLTLMNSNVSVSARIGRDGIVAPMSWDGLHSDRAKLKNISVHIDTEPGDTVWTSGMSLFFPADIPIGITGKSRLVFGSTSEVDVTLLQDFSSLKYVTVATNRYIDEIKNLTDEER